MDEDKELNSLKENCRKAGNLYFNSKAQLDQKLEEIAILQKEVNRYKEVYTTLKNAVEVKKDEKLKKLDVLLLSPQSSQNVNNLNSFKPVTQNLGVSEGQTDSFLNTNTTQLNLQKYNYKNQTEDASSLLQNLKNYNQNITGNTGNYSNKNFYNTASDTTKKNINNMNNIGNFSPTINDEYNQTLDNKRLNNFSHTYSNQNAGNTLKINQHTPVRPTQNLEFKKKSPRDCITFLEDVISFLKKDANYFEVCCEEVIKFYKAQEEAYSPELTPMMKEFIKIAFVSASKCNNSRPLKKVIAQIYTKVEKMDTEFIAFFNSLSNEPKVFLPSNAAQRQTSQPANTQLQYLLPHQMYQLPIGYHFQGHHLPFGQQQQIRPLYQVPQSLNSNQNQQVQHSSREHLQPNSNQAINPSYPFATGATLQHQHTQKSQTDTFDSTDKSNTCDYQCSLCGVNFSTKEKLNAHIKQKCAPNIDIGADQNAVSTSSKDEVSHLTQNSTNSTPNVIVNTNNPLESVSLPNKSNGQQQMVSGAFPQNQNQASSTLHNVSIESIQHSSIVASVPENLNSFSTQVYNRIPPVSITPMQTSTKTAVTTAPHITQKKSLVAGTLSSEISPPTEASQVSKLTTSIKSGSADLQLEPLIIYDKSSQEYTAIEKEATPEIVDLNLEESMDSIEKDSISKLTRRSSKDTINKITKTPIAVEPIPLPFESSSDKEKTNLMFTTVLNQKFDADNTMNSTRDTIKNPVPIINERRNIINNATDPYEGKFIANNIGSAERNVIESEKVIKLKTITEYTSLPTKGLIHLMGNLRNKTSLNHLIFRFPFSDDGIKFLNANSNYIAKLCIYDYPKEAKEEIKFISVEVNCVNIVLKKSYLFSHEDKGSKIYFEGDIPKNCLTQENIVRISNTIGGSDRAFCKILMYGEIDFDSLLYKIKHDSRLDAGSTIRKINDKITQMNITSESSNRNHEELSIRFSLMDPISKKKIGYPVRGFMCQHLECFDLKSWYDQQLKTPNSICPICSNPIIPLSLKKLNQENLINFNLIFDEYFNYVLESDVVKNLKENSNVMIDAFGDKKFKIVDNINDRKRISIDLTETNTSKKVKLDSVKVVSNFTSENLEFNTKDRKIKEKNLDELTKEVNWLESDTDED
ncbi:hypothetical protein HK099_006388 [Clydaea vesicula]|uniref:Uncharacterized protein n=1 Tax=Clydaea vesicula TaxID=447962 RepID=A0AAD5XY98_9FUNG|nr:hypothetical protein HK099_006388 [Clydaea vesicula]